MVFFEVASFSFPETATVLLILVVFSFLSHAKKSLTTSGIFVGNIVGLTVFLFGGLSSFLVIVVFFAVAEVSTRYSRKKIKQEHEQRTTSNIIGNSGAALISLVFGSTIGFFGAMAAALSDTISSEIGMLSKKKPRLISSFKEVDIGTDGGITTTGLVAGVIGAAIVASMHFYLTLNSVFFIIIVVAGFSGAVVDSLLGDFFERSGQLNNTQVNFFASLSSAIIAVLLKLMF